MGNKGVVAKGSHEDFEISKVGLASRENQAGMQQLAIEFLHLLQVMGRVRQPNLDGSSVFGPFPLSESHSVIRKVPIKTQKRYG